MFVFPTVLTQSANRAKILAKILSYATRAGFRHFLEASPLFKDFTPLHC